MAFPKQLAHGSREHKLYTRGAWVAFVLFVILVAFAYVDVGTLSIGDNNYNLSVTRLTKAVAFMVAILGLQVIVGFTGQLALGQSFFFGTGAYLTAWLVADHDWPVLLTLVVVVPFCFVVGMVLGLPAVRVRGLYLALVTLGMAQVFPAIISLQQLQEYTNGAGGKLLDSDLVAPSWIPFDGIAGFLQSLPLVGDFFGDGDLSSREEERLWKFMLAIAIAGVCFWMVSNLVKSRPGRAIRAVRDNETGAAVSGINLALTKTLSFGVASALGGVGGVIYVAELGIASPLDFSLVLAINFIVGLVVGGVGTLSGAVIGGLVITLIPDWSSATQSAGFLPERWLQGPTGAFILGVLLIILTFVLPGGIVAGFRRLRARFVQVMPPVIPGAGAATTSAEPPAEMTDEDEREPTPSSTPGG
ncbi:MAG: branched-chain amino acid ABC transporter permease [Actinomycetota bacterium]